MNGPFYKINYLSQVLKRPRILPLIFFLIFFYQKKAEAVDYRVGALNFPPLVIVSDTDVVKGTHTELLTKILKTLKIKYSVEGFPPSRLYNNIKHGKIDIFIGIKGVKQYDDVVLYSKESPGFVEVMCYTTNASELPKVESDLIGKRVLLIRGYCYGDLGCILSRPENISNIHMVNNHVQAIKMLTAGRVKYLVDYKKPVEWLSKKHKISLEGIKMTSLKKLKLYFIVSGKAKNAKSLLTQIETTFKKFSLK